MNSRTTFFSVRRSSTFSTSSATLIKDAFADLSNQMAQMRERMQKLEVELRRLAATAAATGPSAFLVEAINEREKQLFELSMHKMKQKLIL